MPPQRPAIDHDISARPGAHARRGPRSRRAAICALAGLATLGLAGTCAAHYSSVALTAQSRPTWGPAGGPVAGSAAGQSGGPRTPSTETKARALRLAASGQSWLGSLLEGLFGMPQQPPRMRPEPRRLPQPNVRSAPAPPSPAQIGTFRTMCVRLCDGYYWPVSFSTSRDNFARDEKVCTKSCGSPAALYYYPNPGGEAAEMVSLQGVPYKNLSTAFLHRTGYDPSCKCRPHPWEPEAIERHKAYASQPSQVRSASTGTRRSR